MRLRNTGQAMVLPHHFADIQADENNSNSRFTDSEIYTNTELIPSHLEDNCLSTNALCNSNLNNNEGSIERQRHCSESASDDSIGPYEGQSSSSIDIFPQGDEYQCFSQEDATDSDFSDDGNCGKDESDDLISGVVNPNYFTEFEEKNDLGTDRNGNGRDSDSVNHFDSDHHAQKDFYDKPKFEGCYEIHDLNIIGEASENSVCEVTGNYAAAGHDNVFPEINFVISSVNHKFEFSPKESYQDSGVCSVATTDGEFDSYETTFLVQTAQFPISGVFETAILPEDDSDVTPSPVDESPTMDCSQESCSKLAKDSENEKRVVEREVEKKRKQPSWFSSAANDEKNSIRKSDAARMKNDLPTLDMTARRTGNPKSRAYSGSRRQDMKPPIDIGVFDVYNIETTMPNFDLDAIESHLKAAKEEEQRVAESLWRDRSNNNRAKTDNSTESVDITVEVNPIANSPSSYFNSPTLDLKWPVLVNNEMHWLPKVPQEDEREDLIERFNSISQVRSSDRRRNDRDEIRRRLAMGPDNDELYCGERMDRGRKPSLQSRLQSGMNLQICFMNDTGSDSESPNTDTDSVDSQPLVDNNIPAAPHYKNSQTLLRGGPRPSPANLTLPLKKNVELRTEADLFACQARLQSEARQALMQAKEMARMQMEVERQRMPLSPITQMVRTSLLKVGVPFPEERRRLSRQILTEMNVAQLQVIINDLHSQIEVLNENLVEYLMGRDDLHMEQDSMLVDIEDLTRYIEAKEQLLPEVEMRTVPSRENQNAATPGIAVA